MPELLDRLKNALADRYRVERELGWGGMATVYLAEDLKHERRVAVKVLKPELAAVLGPDRFLREIKVTAQLNHPHILPLHDSGIAEGFLYYVMPYVEGESLRDRLTRETQLPVDDALGIAREVADALSYAHSLGVVHRDIKPENILFEAGHAVVSDFGIARAVSQAGAERLTETGLAVGTPAYMSPEQASGAGEVDARSDIYSLACVLYEMLVGATPYTGPSAHAIIARKALEPVPSLRVVRETIPVPVERAVMRALAKVPADRFSTAARFAAALSGRAPAEPRWPGLVAPNRLIAAASVVVVVAAASYLVLALRGRVAERGPLATSFSQLTAEPGVESFPSLSPDGQWLVYAGEGSGNHDIYLKSVGGENPINLTADSPVDDDQPAFSPDGERIAFRSAREGGGIFVMGRTGEAVKRVTRLGFRPTWSPDGTRLAFSTENVELNPQNMEHRGEIWIADVRTGQQRELGVQDGILPSWSPHGYRIAYAHRLGKPPQAKIWTIPVEGGEPAAVTSDVATDWNPAWSPDGQYLYFASDRGGSMNLWRVSIDEKSGKTLGDPEPLTTPATLLTQISPSADGRHIAYSSVLVTSNIEKMALDPATGTVISEPSWVTTGSRRWSSPDPSPDAEWVAFYSLVRPEGDIYVAHPDGTGLRQVTGDTAIDRVPRWSPDGKWIAFFSNRGGPIQLWKIRPDGSDLQQLTERGGVYVAWSPDGSRMAVRGAVSGGGDSTRGVYLLDPNQPSKEQTPRKLPQPVGPLVSFRPNSWSPDGQWLAGDLDTQDVGIVVYSMRSDTYQQLTDVGQWPVWLPDSRRLLFVSGGKGFYLLGRVSTQVRKIFSVSRDVLGPPRLTRDGRTMYYSRRVTEADIWLLTLR